ncbi:MAG: type II toxin-antitoxin system VapC family toxin [Actinomycetota bacterium]
MITYVETSTLLKLVIDEDGSDRADTIWTSADAVASVALIVVESSAALAAAKRGRRLTAEQHAEARENVDVLVDDLYIVEVNEELILIAADLADAEALRGYDVVRLAAAVLIGATVLSSADEDLCDAAGRLGLHVANPLMAG